MKPVIKFEAYDGIYFDTESECIRYEDINRQIDYYS
jgi:hypothetical protein